MLQHVGQLARFPAGGFAASRPLLDEASTLLSEHARQLHTSAAALSASPAQPGQATAAAPAAGAAAQSGEAPPPAVAAAQQRGAQPAGGALAEGAASQPQPQSQAHMQSWGAVPGVAKVLGLAGLIPFIGLAPPIAAHIPLLPPEVLADAGLLQITYGATIASFLGGIHWGVAMLDPRQGAAKAALERYLWSVTPPLMAFPAVLFPGGPGAFIVATTLGLCHIVDRSFWRRGLLPPWYMSLRLPLTMIAIGGLGVTIAGDLMGQQQQQQQPVVEPAEPEQDA